jgi:uncharacterized protein (DUF433 family)
MGTTLKGLESQLAALTDAEKSQLLQILAGELTHTWPGIQKHPRIAGGSACIVHTRIPVWTLERYRQLGWTESRILDNFPGLCAADLVAAWSYAAGHGEEIASEIRHNEEA